MDFSAEVSLLDQSVRDLVETYGAEKVGVLFVGTDEFSLIIQQMGPYQNADDVRWFATNTQAYKLRSAPQTGTNHHVVTMP